MPDLIRKSTRNEFRECLVNHSVLREIAMIFDGAGLVQNQEHNPAFQGERRGLVEQYYANVDFNSIADVRNILSAYGEVIQILLRKGCQSESDDLLSRMEKDGFTYNGGEFSNGGWPGTPSVVLMREIAAVKDLPELLKQVERINSSIEEDPSLAIGTAKELVETVCKTILDERGSPVDLQDMGKLTRAVADELNLHPSDIDQDSKGADTIRRILGNLGQLSQGLAELRNLYGTGHGRSGRATGLQPRHARLAVGAASTLTVFLLETHAERNSRNAGSAR